MFFGPPISDLPQSETQLCPQFSDPVLPLIPVFRPRKKEPNVGPASLVVAFPGALRLPGLREYRPATSEHEEAGQIGPHPKGNSDEKNGMEKIQRRDFLLPLLLVMALGTLALMLFDRVTHNDYEPAKCDSGGIEISAELIGDYGQNGRQNRASPYRLRLTADSVRNAPGELRAIRMKALSSNQIAHLEHITAQEIDRPVLPLHSLYTWRTVCPWTMWITR